MSRILIIDDSPTEMHLLKSMLEKHGHEILEATSGEEGIETAKAQQPELVLMDVVMPEMNGFQATRKLSKMPETSAIPVIIVSTKSQETDKVWGLRQGAKEYLTKPVTESELIEKVNAIING